MRGLRLENGSWKTTCTSRRSGPQLPGRQVVDAPAVEHHLAVGDVEQPQDGLADRGLAAARLADQRQRLALADRERDAVDGVHVAAHGAEKAAGYGEVLLEVADLEEGRAHAVTASRAAWWQATQCPAALSSSAGAACRQTSVACAQRPAKTQPRMRLIEARDQPRDLREPLAVARQRRAELRHGAEQALRVGVPGPRKQLASRRLLDLAARVHDDDVLGHLGDDAQIVRDEHDRRADAALELAHQIEDLRLHGDVERGGRLVGDQQLGIAGERHGDHDALAHAARHLVRILVDAPLRLGDADQRQHLDGALLGRRAVEALVQPQASRAIWRPTVSTGLSDVIGSWKIIEMSLPRMSRISRSESSQQVAASKAMRPAILPGRLGDQPQDRHGGDGLAATRLADDGERLPGLELERDAVDRAVDALRGAEVRLQVLDLEQGHGASAPTASWPCADRARRAGRRRAGSRPAP